MKEPIFTISNQILSYVSKIETCRANVNNYVLLPEREAELHYRATVENTHSSTSIEGNPLNDKQVASVLKSKTKLPLTLHRYAEIEVRNYKEALDFINKRSLDKSPISLKDILAIHKILMKKLLPAGKVGKLRSGEVYIVNQDDDVEYTGAPAKICKQELEDLFTWVAKTDLHPYVAAGILHLLFISIHPFSDGNGRCTRLLTLLYLGIKDYDFNKALVLDNFYADDKPRYYAELQKAHGTKYGKITGNGYVGWVEYFLEGFLSSAQVLEATAQILSISTKPLGAVQKLPADDVDILSYVAQFGEVTISEAESILPHLSRRSIQRKLQNLVDGGHLKLEGGSKNSAYVSATKPKQK